MILIGIPTYNGQVMMDTLSALQGATNTHQAVHAKSQSSLLTYAFNNLWAMALNMKVSHFCMLHADILPEDGWLDKMMDIMITHEADVLSAIVPIKTNAGMTSTAIDDTGDKWRVRRLTMHQIYDMEPTFTAPDLLINTGLMLVDMRAPWVHDMWFRFEDHIANEGGKRVAKNMPEDWLFSRDARAHGARIYATREVKLDHVGSAKFTNTVPWGAARTDNVRPLRPVT